MGCCTWGAQQFCSAAAPISPPLLPSLIRRCPSSRRATRDLPRHCLRSALALRIVRKGGWSRRRRMPLGLILSSLGKSMRRKRLSSLDILSSKRAPRDYYKGKNCKPTGFHTRKGGYVMVDEKLPRFVVPDLTDFKLKPYVSQCARDITASTASSTSAETSENKN
uniref:39S ribosomal protein L41-A, mitochondrial n=1 Tax=Leersia perrieri TaxID=77586 RepID=A0A0D9VID3_9ORYZ